MTHVHALAKTGFEKCCHAYENGRPGYPIQAVGELYEQLNIRPESRIVDLGAGTGKFTRFLSLSRAEVIAVEPVRGMRQKFSTLYPGIKVMDGEAEKMPVEAGTIDAVVCAQSFHWFNTHLALPEIHRVLKPGGRLGLIWNVSDNSTRWMQKLNHILEPHRAKTPNYRDQPWKKTFSQTELFTPLLRSNYRHVHHGNLKTVPRPRVFHQLCRSHARQRPASAVL